MDPESTSNHDLLIKISTDVEWIKDRLKDMQEDIEELKAFKWKVIGIAIGVSTTVSIIVSVLVSILH